MARTYFTPLSLVLVAPHCRVRRMVLIYNQSVIASVAKQSPAFIYRFAGHPALRNLLRRLCYRLALNVIKLKSVLKIQKRRTTKNSKRKHKVHKAWILFALCFFVKNSLCPLWLKN